MGIGRQSIKFDESMGKVMVLKYRILRGQKRDRRIHQISEGGQNKS